MSRKTQPTNQAEMNTDLNKIQYSKHILKLNFI